MQNRKTNKKTNDYFYTESFANAKQKNEQNDKRLLLYRKFCLFVNLEASLHHISIYFIILLLNHREKLWEKYSKLLIKELLSEILAGQYPSSM